LESRYSFLKFSFVDRLNLPLQSESALVGEHNLDNMSVAMTVVEKMQWPAKAQEAMRAFPGLAHRMENVGRFQNILFINDSKATTMDSVLQAFKSVQKQARGHVHLLLGGRDKNLPWSQLSVLKNVTNLQIHFFGEFGEGAKTQSQLPGSSEKTLQQCLATLKNTLQPQDIVLLSPGGTSLDEFKNFEDRGDFFKRWVLSEFKN
jgi:UDP-N-acetylmuramoylalanine--D-glutamate ligase